MICDFPSKEFCADETCLCFRAGRQWQDVWEYSAATSSSGAAEERSKHQEDFRQSGRRGYQGEIGTHPHVRRRFILLQANPKISIH